MGWLVQTLSPLRSEMNLHYLYLHELSGWVQEQIFNRWSLQKVQRFAFVAVVHTSSSQSADSLYSNDYRNQLQGRWTPLNFSQNLQWPSHPPLDSIMHVKNSCWAAVCASRGSWLRLGRRWAEPTSAGQLKPTWSPGTAGGVFWQPSALRNNALVNRCLGTSAS